MKLNETIETMFFEHAMILARDSFAAGYSPVGAVVTMNGEVIAARGSQREIGNTNHAEFRALNWLNSVATHLPEQQHPLTLYSTFEPCIMCSSMAAILKFDHLYFLVDDVWAGGTRLLNRNKDYVQKRFPTMDKVEGLPELHLEAQEMWVKYLRATGHNDALAFILGLPEDYELQGPLKPYYAQAKVR